MASTRDIHTSHNCSLTNGKLLHKLRNLGISGKLGLWLHCLVTDQKQLIAVDGGISKMSEVISGVP